MSEKEKILITGGSGFIGSQIAKRLLETRKDVKIVILDNFLLGKEKNIEDIKDHESIEIVKGDIRDRELLDKIIPGTKTLYHMAAIVGVDFVIKNEDLTWDVEVNGTRNILEICNKHNVKNIFLASSSECYGKYEEKDLPMKESDNITPNTNYGKAKFECEKMCEDYAKKNNMTCTIARYFNVYGSAQSSNGYVIPNMIKCALEGQPITIYGHGNQTRDFMYVVDAIDATIKLTEQGKSGVYNIGSGKRITINDLAELVIELTNSKSKILHAEIRRPTDIESKLSDNTKTKETIDWTPKHSLKEGIEKTIESYKKEVL